MDTSSLSQILLTKQIFCPTFFWTFYQNFFIPKKVWQTHYWSHNTSMGNECETNKNMVSILKIFRYFNKFGPFKHKNTFIYQFQILPLWNLVISSKLIFYNWSNKKNDNLVTICMLIRVILASVNCDSNLKDNKMKRQDL